MLKSLLPNTENNSDKDYEAAIGESVSAFNPEIEKLNYFLDFDKVEEAWLDAIAENFGIDYWRNSWSKTVKQQYLKFGFELKKKAGTPWAIKKIIDIFAPGSKLLEWFELNEDAGKARIDINGPNLKIANEEFTALINIYKNVRTSFAFRKKAHTQIGMALTANAITLRGIFMLAGTNERAYEAKTALVGIAQSRQFKTIWQ